MTDDPGIQSNEASAQAKLDELSIILRDLHRAIIEAEGRNFGPVSGPFELLNLAVTHPHFAWLRPLTTLIAALDERRTEDDPLDAQTVADYLARVDALVGSGAEPESEFRRRVTELIQQSPEVAMAHGTLRTFSIRNRVV